MVDREWWIVDGMDSGWSGWWIVDGMDSGWSGWWIVDGG
jgi:hypothetical protein